jgi:hypothetical protein
VDSSFPIGLNGRDKALWDGHAFVCDISCIHHCSSSLNRPRSESRTRVRSSSEPIWAQGSLATTYSLVLVFPSGKAILEALTGPNRPWGDLHHRSYFLQELKKIEAGKFVLTMTVDRSYPINPLHMHVVYTEINMECSIETIPIDISRTHGIMENVFIGVDYSPKEIRIYTELFK